MKIQIFSDVHADINKIQSPSEILDTSEKVDLFIDAGDTGSLLATKNFYQNQFWKNKQSVFIGGNHLCYGVDKTLSQVEDELRNEFHINNNVTFLQNEEKHFDDIIVLGTTLWTDFNVFNNKQFHMKVCNKSINDFRSVLYTEDSYLTPKNVITLHNLSKKYIHKRLIKNPNKKFIIVTHHTPSLRSAATKYLNDPITAGFCNNMESFIKEHNNILLWIHGHVHNNCSYFIDKTPVVCNPLGYVRFGEMSGFLNNAILEF